MAVKKNKLIRMSWRRPSEQHEGGYVSGILYRKCFSHENPDTIIAGFQKLAVDEGYNREILSIEVYEEC
jgi:hypothetical protein